MQLTTPDDAVARAPADGEPPRGRIVVPGTAERKADPAVYGDGLARVLDALTEVMPRTEVEALWAFPGVRREGREYGVVVVSRHGEGERRRVYRARYVLDLKGQDRGQTLLEVEETAEAPAGTLPRVIEGVRRRADEAGEADLVDLAQWRAAGSDEADPG